MADLRVEMIVATTDRLEVYGGFQLTVEELEGMAASLRKGTPMHNNHNALRPMRTANVEAGVRQRLDGEYEVWAEMDVDADDWAAYEADREAAGAPGGISFSAYRPFAEVDGPDVGFEVRVAANAHHTSGEALVAAGQAFIGVAPVRLSRIYQFSFEPPDLVVIGFVLNEALSIPAGVVANLVSEAIKGVIRPTGTPEVRLEVQRTVDGQATTTRTMAVIPVNTPEAVAKRAVKAWSDVSDHEGAWAWSGDETDGEWRRVDEP